MKKRNPKAQTEKKGVTHVRQVTNDAGHIFREVLEEDLGIDGHIEVCRDNEPTGVVVGLQIKAGESYIRSETPEAFTYYPKVDDLKYWSKYSLPLFLVIYRPCERKAYWVDIKRYFKEHKLEDMLCAIEPKKLILDKRNVFSENFFDLLEQEFDEKELGKYWYDLFLQSLRDVTSNEVEELNIPRNLWMSLYQLDINAATRLLEYLCSRQDELFQALVRRRSIKENLVNTYVSYLVQKLRERIFELEGTGFIMMAFEKREDRDYVGETPGSINSLQPLPYLKGGKIFSISFFNELLSDSCL